MNSDISNGLLVGGGRGINSDGTVDVEIVDDRTSYDRAHNKPSSELRKKILALPEQPGVYMYVDKLGKVIYVGKAKRLKRRVSSYFNRIHDSRKTNQLVHSIADLRFIVVSTEQEALNLEASMIRHFQPRYNVLLKDDKSYPMIVVTKEPYPRVFMTRDKVKGAGHYYGPFSNVGAAKEVLNLIRDNFPLRSCSHLIDSQVIARDKLRLCLDFHLNKCGGCCKGRISEEEYGENVVKVRQILKGETSPLIRQLKAEMEHAASELRFEDAQEIKLKIEKVEAYSTRNIVAATDSPDADVMTYVENASSAFVNYMHIHHGAVVRTITLEYRRSDNATPEEIMSMAIGEIMRRFEISGFNELILPFVPDMEFDDVRVIVPQRGEKRKLLDVSKANAERYMADLEKMVEERNPEKGVDRLMDTMKSDFRLSAQPRHIECFDNSNIQGTNPVASCVVFRNGKPSKREYRTYKIKTVEGPDDFASMKEVLHRRYTRLMAEGEELPQLVVVDGGKGQLSAAVEAFDEMGIRGSVALVGIAKRLEEIYFPGDSLPLYIDKKSPSLGVIMKLRDEAHRFGITFHRKLRSKGQVKSELDGIKGIGPVNARKLMLKFKSLKRIREASKADLEEVVGKAKAEVISEYFKKVKDEMI